MMFVLSTHYDGYIVMGEFLEVFCYMLMNIVPSNFL